MKSFNIGSLALITNNVPNPNILLQTPITGLDAPPHRTNAYSLPGQDGAIVSSQFYDMRTVTLEGVVYASNPTDFEAARQALAAACAIQKDLSGYPIPTRITFTTLAGNNYFFDAYIDRPIMDFRDPNFSYFQITMQVTNPFIFGASQVVSANIAPATGGGFILPVILPIASGAATGGVVTVVNNGNAPSYPLITITGPMSHPNLYNSTVNKTMSLNTNINSGDKVVIDMLQKTITLNGSSSLLSAKTTDSEWWAINPGSNQISISTISSSDTGFASAAFYPSYLGV